jgi:hypothetical protein
MEQPNLIPKAKTNFSIVMQGRIDEITLLHVKKSLNYSDDVIVVSWRMADPLQHKVENKIKDLGAKIVIADDPHSILAYEENRVKKTLNVNRQMLGINIGASLAKYEKTIKTRTDLSINYQEFFSRWILSKRPCASLNITSVAPRRLLAPPFLFHVSDWCIGSETSRFVKQYKHSISEEHLKRTTPCKIRGLTWHVRLSAEQVLAGILTGENVNFNGENHKSLELNKRSDWLIDKQIKSYFCNINRRGLEFFSTKYKARSNQWLVHDHPFFKDDQMLKPRIDQLLIHILARCLLCARAN